MINFNSRSTQKELLDRDDIPFADISRNMQELEFINKYLGGHQITLAGLKRFLSNSSKSLHICEIGCGGGDNLTAIYKWGKENGWEFRFTGIDINKDCIKHAKSRSPIPEVDWIASDYKDVEFENKPAIIFTSLFCHHFTDGQLIEQIRWMREHSEMGFFINDLHRHPLAYHSIKFLTKLFSKSYLVKNDAPLSVLRGFRKNELEQILAQSGCTGASITWKWAFRWLLVQCNHPVEIIR